MNDSPEHKKGSSLKWLLIILTATLILVLFFLGWLPRQKNEKAVNDLANATNLPRVVVMEIVPNTQPISLILPSSAQAWHYTPIWSRVNGYIMQYFVDIGDFVHEGDLLTEIDTPETDEQLAQAEADLLNATAERDIAKITSDRWEALWNKNQQAVSKQEVDQYSANLKSAEAIVLMNEKNVARYKYQQGFKHIFAPFDGVITQRLIDIGTLVYGAVNASTQELFQMVQTGVIRFYVYVPQTYYTQIQDGLPAEVSIEQLPGKTFKGTVARFAKALDPISRTLLTEVDVENQEGLIYAGLFGKVKFLLEPRETNFIIPTTAVIVRATYPHVAVVDKDNKVHLKRVDIGRDYGDRMEIINGLALNDRIITIPTDSIQEGIKVQIIAK